MCAVSVILDYGRLTFPNLDWFKPNPLPILSVLPIIPPKDVEIVTEFLRLIKQSAKLDLVSGEQNCEDPKKVEFLRGLLTKLDNINNEISVLKKEVKELLKLDEVI